MPLRPLLRRAIDQKAAELIETKRPRDYDLATSLRRDLQALADRQEDSAAFRKRFGELRQLPG